MVSSYPYPPAFLTWMRTVFAAPQPFIAACLAQAQAQRLTGETRGSGRGGGRGGGTVCCSPHALTPPPPRAPGLNIDWEPTSGNGAPTPTAQDAADYAAFLDAFATAMHAAGVAVTVDVATWSPIWNLTAIGATAVDGVALMSTYTDDWPTWQRVFAEAVAAVPAGKLVVGLETTRSDNSPYPTPELAQRFAAIKAAGLRRVGVWRAPIPDNWWPFLNAL
jgi:hypothetical protein